MTVWDDVVGQQNVVQTLQRAAEAARRIVTDHPSTPDQAMSQAWLLTGPPGSGRSTAARSFAAALECTGETPGCGECSGCTTVLAGTHPDVEHLETHGVTITIAQARDLVKHTYEAPIVGHWRVLIVEDADRMADHTANVLLKAIEEPPERTVWVLAAPSPADVISTIRSRCRILHLVTPSVDDVAHLLQKRDGIDAHTAQLAAQISQAHIGRARGLAMDEAAREERSELISAVVSLHTMGDVEVLAQSVAAKAKEAATKHAEDDAEQQKSTLVHTLGVDESSRLPSQVRGQMRDIDAEYKRRNTRLVRDAVDRAMVDVLSVYRDVLLVGFGAHVALINQDFADDIRRLAATIPPEDAADRMETISRARVRLSHNVTPLLALEAMFASLRIVQ
ncbi:MAG: DNA polymerase III subunit delta' [Actinomycetaceae bacterium]|nr:DNA polymerase III subunit delta' [Actinomycetaceae bacterium]MDY6082517.1 DNA polymerase III subunit delta' [Actinomycetaceae bacterium]